MPNSRASERFCSSLIFDSSGSVLSEKTTTLSLLKTAIQPLMDANTTATLIKPARGLPGLSTQKHGKTADQIERVA